MNDTLDTGDIAEFLHFTREYVTDRLVKQADFPAPIINRTRRMRRWKREDVERWAMGSQSLDAISSEVAL